MFKKKKKYEDEFEYENEEFEDEAYDEYEEDYDDAEESSKSSHMFMVILSILLLAVAILCIVLTFSLRSSKKQVASLKEQVETLTSEQNATLWSYSTAPATSSVSTEPASTAGTESSGVSTEPATTTVESPAATQAPEATPQPTPTPSAEPVVTSSTPSWVDESAINGQVRIPKEWYAAPGKLYVTADIALRVRYGPSTDYGIVCTVAHGAEVSVYAESGDWRFIKDEKGNYGWASIKLMSTSPAE